MANKKIDIYDYIVIGGGLTGLTVATMLSRFSDKVLLLEALDHVGGVNRSIQTKCGEQNNGLRFIAYNKLTEKAFDFVKNLIQEDIQLTNHEIPPITYESGSLKPFVGFGDNPPAFYNEMEYFTAVDRCEMNISISQLIQKLTQKFLDQGGEFLTKSYVTKFITEGEKATAVMVNGQKTIQAQNFIFAGHIKDLSVLLPQEAISPRARQKLAKNKYWNALCLDLCHNHIVTDNKAMHVLNGTTQDDIGPCVGQFLNTSIVENYADNQDGKVEQPVQYSQWMTFIDVEDSEDPENLGAALKKIKRQINRAYPNATDNLISERIAVFEYYGGNGDLKLSSNQSLPDLGNVWIASTTMNPTKNIVGSLLQAELVCSALGFSIEESAVAYNETASAYYAEAVVKP